MVHELRVQEWSATPDDGGPPRLWHVVETGQFRSLCGHAVAKEADARPLADLAEIDLDRCCETCEQVYRTAAAEALDQPLI
ncbi:hypothetical protein [Streptacidiphilus anmyonensis]|uniref:hypothetical protein n=1 Tax=Streptacidiphilus anmyonensis TaxID=405782 RepID=UPI0005A65E35|nr:hypothetical protein [Streptacidiphilus anmyonensis]